MEQLFIGGEYVASTSDRSIAVENPATEETLTEVPDASGADIDRAVEAAGRAQREWRKTDTLARAELLHECASRLSAAKHELGLTLTR